METGDDAAVWRLGADRALVVTADFITPVVDDARVWGRIAAVNSASDVYAMGGRPILALNLVAWNTEELTDELLAQVLLGAEEAAAEGGWVTVGGHTVDDPEPKFGLVVVGEVHPDRILTNAGLRDGDILVLTKALGTGIVSTAMKSGEVKAPVAAAAIASMLTSNAERPPWPLACGRDRCDRCHRLRVARSPGQDGRAFVGRCHHGRRGRPRPSRGHGPGRCGRGSWRDAPQPGVGRGPSWTQERPTHCRSSSWPTLRRRAA